MKKSLIVVALIMAMTGCEERTCPPAVDYTLAGCISGETFIDAEGHILGKELSDYGSLLMSINKKSDTEVSISIGNLKNTFRLDLGVMSVSGESFDVFFDEEVPAEACTIEGMDYDSVSVGVEGRIEVLVPYTGSTIPEYSCSLELSDITGDLFAIKISGMDAETSNIDYWR